MAANARRVGFFIGAVLLGFFGVPGASRVDAASTSHGSASPTQLNTASAAGQLSPSPGSLGSVAPVRVLDTRTGNGAPRAAVGAGRTLAVKVTGLAGVPAAGVAAVVVNVTVTQPTAGGYITAWADGAARPGTSNLDFSAGQSVPNLAVVPVGADGDIALFNGSPGTVQLIVDVTGYYRAGIPTAAGALGSVAPARVLDTRTGNGAPQVPVGGGRTIAVKVTGLAGVPAAGVAAVVVNVTVTQPTAGGYITAWG